MSSKPKKHLELVFCYKHKFNIYLGPDLILIVKPQTLSWPGALQLGPALKKGFNLVCTVQQLLAIH